MTRAPDAGFTLIETLVALAVLAVGAVTLLTAIDRYAARVGGLSDRIVARWVAENALAASQLGLADEPRWRDAMGIGWRVRTDARPLPGTGLSAVTVTVAPDDAAPGAGLVTLTGYIAAGTGGGE